jgi:DNA-binding transcriptional regulator YiaG
LGCCKSIQVGALSPKQSANHQTFLSCRSLHAISQLLRISGTTVAVLTGVQQATLVSVTSNPSRTGQQTMPKKQEVPAEQLKQCATVLLSARMTAGISQRELSKRINVTQPLVSSWEQGKTLPSINHLAAIEEATGATQGSIIMPIAYWQHTES